MCRFTIRDLLWLMVVVALGVGWWQEHRTADARLREAVRSIASMWSDEVGHTVRFSVKGQGAAVHIFAIGIPDK
jgi:hypothetical protein